MRKLKIITGSRASVPEAESGNRTGLLVLAYFFSGSAALLYQVVWQRFLLFSTGVGTVSISLIISSFLAGLGLGYLAGGWIADKMARRRLIPVFILLELGIVAFALMSKSLLYDSLGSFPGVGPATPVRTCALLFVMLLGPTMMMGMSLPVLSKVVRLSDMLAQAGLISRLYFSNTLGGAFGALLAAVVIIPLIGLERTTWVGASLNLLCVVFVVIATRGMIMSTDSDSEPDAGLETAPPRLPSRWWMLHYFVSGFTVIAFEVLWFRIIENAVKAYAQTFAVILAVFLCAMALGVIIGDQLRERLGMKGGMKTFFTAQIALYGSMALGLILFAWAVERLPLLAGWFEYLESYEPKLAPSEFLLNYVVLPVGLLGFPGLMMGVSFSISQQIVQRDFRNTGRTLGTLLAANLSGSVIGAWVVVFLGLDVLGTARAASTLAAFGMAYGVAWWFWSPRPVWQPAFGTLLVGLLVLAMPSNRDFWRVLHGMRDASHILVREDAAGVSCIKLYEGGEPRIGVVFANGLGQSSLPRTNDLVHIELGAIPALLHPNPIDVAVIGLGSGGTAWAIGCRPETASVDCFEVVRNQPDILREYARIEGYPVAAWFDNDPRVRIHHGDGRHALLRNGKLYDIIEADALRPRSSGAGNLYSLEYFRLARSRLKPGGILATWIPTPRVLDTVSQVFPHVRVYNGFVGICSENEIVTDWDAVRVRLENPWTSRYFSTAGIDPVPLLAPAFNKPVGNAPNKDASVNTDMFPRDEFGDMGEALLRLFKK